MMNATLLLAMTVGAPALKEKPVAETLVGEWKAETITVGGKPAASQGSDVRWIFDAEGGREITKGGRRAAKGIYVVDPKAKPAILDLDKSPSAEPEYKCIYKIDGDTLTLNVGWPKADRPSEFASPDGAKCTLYVFKRVRAKD